MLGLFVFLFIVALLGNLSELLSTSGFNGFLLFLATFGPVRMNTKLNGKLLSSSSSACIVLYCIVL
ncbi:hypothetical protein T07_12184 [Trichinella nelsoni]|uniref:Uncharacterized protein n=1 Tax=Trichinella nelsoni TaxID=6336 RepID=A0A0V0SBF2_9BILA|nr:hypothetical protein T07_12184 [Trichinella nelsoni]